MVIVKFKGKDYKFRYTKEEMLALNANGGTDFLNNLVDGKDQNTIAIAFGAIILGAFVPDTDKKNYISTIQFQNSACYRHLWKLLAMDPKVSARFMKYVTAPRGKCTITVTDKETKKAKE